MKRHSFIYALVVAVAAIMGSCRADIDLQNIDKRAELDMGLAMPIGSISANLGDFLGNGEVEGIYVDPQSNLLYFLDTFRINRTYHDINLEEKTGDVSETFNVHKALKNMGRLDADGKVTGDGKEIVLSFPCHLNLKHINEAGKLDDERFDKALMEEALFSSIITCTKNMPVKKEWVDEVVIVLGDQFTRKAGKDIIVCQKNSSEYNEFAYGTNLPIEVDEFTIDLLNGQKPTTYEGFKNAVVDTCGLHIDFHFTIPKGLKVEIPTTAAYMYDLKVTFMQFSAIWGYFKPSSDMRDADVLIIEEEWPKWRDLTKATLPFSDPQVKMYVRSKIAGAMVMHGDYLYAKSDTKNDSVFATFDEAMTEHRHEVHFLEGTFRDGYYDGGYMPLNSQVTDSAKMLVLFDKSWQNGHIEKLFQLRPDKLGYKFYIDFDTKKTPQIRVRPKTDLKIEAEVYAPFRFDKGMEASYRDTISDINISSWSLDSLQMNSELIDTIKDAQLKMMLKIQNRLPLRAKGWLRFLDANGNMVMDPSDKTKPLRIAQADTLIFEAPKFITGQGYPFVDQNTGYSVYTLDIDREHFETFTSIKEMIFYVELDTKPINPVYDADSRYHVELTANDKLTIQLGITAQGDAVLNFNGNNENK